MSLTALPNELLFMIIENTLPEGFESLAVASTRFHALCTPFIERHNTYRLKWKRFDYRKPIVSVGIRRRYAFSLIVRIAGEPKVARYIRHANFTSDRAIGRDGNRPLYLLPDIPHGEALYKLFARSPYLKRARLNWAEYYGKIEEDLKNNRFSKNAAAFVLTLLPNVEKLHIPAMWDLSDTNYEACHALIDAVISAAQDPQHPLETPSLGQTVVLEVGPHRYHVGNVTLGCISRFLALPRLHTLRSRGLVTTRLMPQGITVRELPLVMNQTLEIIDIRRSWVDEWGIVRLLEHAPCLKTLEYSHSDHAGENSWAWNICAFVSAVSRQVGSHLERLVISGTGDEFFSGSPNILSLQGFRCLQQLSLPLGIALLRLETATSPGNVQRLSASEDQMNQSSKSQEPLVKEIVPASVSKLTLESSGRDCHAEALDVMFRGFATIKDSHLPALQEVKVSMPGEASNAYNDALVRLHTETEKAGVLLQPQYNIDTGHMQRLLRNTVPDMSATLHQT